MRDHAHHAAQVDAWLELKGRDLSAGEFLLLISRALEAVWQRTAVTLGEVTLVAITERVLHDVTARFPPFSTVMVEPSGIQCRELIERVSQLRESDVREGGRFLLIELLTVVGSLTAEILTPDLHSRLGRVALPDPVPSKPIARPRRSESKDKLS